jgi:hypothetical protein
MYISNLRELSISLSSFIRFPRNNDVQFVLTPVCFVGVHVLLMIFVFIYEWWCPTRFPYDMMSFKSNTTSVPCGAGTAYTLRAPELTPGYLVRFVLFHLWFSVSGFVYCLSCCPFLLAFVLSVLRFTNFSYTEIHIIAMFM